MYKLFQNPNSLVSSELVLTDQHAHHQNGFWCHTLELWMLGGVQVVDGSRGLFEVKRQVLGLGQAQIAWVVDCGARGSVAVTIEGYLPLQFAFCSDI